MPSGENEIQSRLDVGHIQKVYALLRDRTGLQIAAIEELLSSLS